MATAKIDWTDLAAFKAPDSDLNWNLLVKGTVDAVKRAEEADQTKMFRASLTTFRGFEVLHTLGDGEDQTGRNAYAKTIGVTGAYVTKCRRLGWAIVSGVEYGGEFWKSLSRHVNNAKVSAILDARDEDGALLPLDVAALTAMVGLLDKAGETGGAKGGKNGKGPKDPAETPVDVVKMTANEAATDAMARIRGALPHMTAAQIGALENGIPSLLADIKAAKAAATDAEAAAKAAADAEADEAASA